MKKNDYWRIPIRFGIRKKWLLAMKISLILLLAFNFSLSASVLSQTRVALNLKNATFFELIQEIESKTDLGFIYNQNDIKNIGVISLDTEDISVEEVLNVALKNSGLDYEIEREIIIIKPAKILPKLEETQQKKTIKGTVTDNDGTPLPGVSVVIKGTITGVATNMDGEYVIEVLRENATLVFSFVGMQAQEVVYAGQQFINVKLEADSEQMEEVVVTGIFNKKKSSYVGSVTTVAEKELKMFGNRNVLSTLKNIDPSFNIMADNVFGSDPNHLPEINMRGSSSLPSLSDLRSDTRGNLNSPLIILDGFEISLQKMIDLNNDEIKSITLLKDASATAIYGSRGANGVVVITTKQPEEGKLKITAKSTINVELADLSSYDVLNAREKLDLELKSGLYTATDFLSNDVILKKLYNQNLTSVEKGNDTDWMSKPLRTGVGQRHNFKIEGGDSKMRYSASVDYNHVAGVMKKSNRKNMNGMVTLAYYHKNLTFRNQLSVGINKSEQSPYGSFNTYVRLNPYWTPYDEEGNLIKIFDRTKPFWGSSFPSNPLYNATLNTVNSSEYTDIINNFSLEWEPTKDIILRGQLGLLKETNSSDLFKPASHTQFDLYKEDDLFRKGSYIYGSGEKFNYDMSFTFNYNKVFAGSHQIYLGLDYSMTEKTEENYSFFIEGFSNDNQSFLPLGLSYQKDGKPSGFENTTRRVGFTSNMNYVYDNRYFVDASYRVDGSSQFGSEKRFAPFWSAGIGWNIHEEDFLTDSGIINRLRLKGSFGTTGSQNFPAYQAARTYNYDYNDRYLNWTGANLLGLGNENLEWQITKQYNVGIESALFNTRVKLSADAYYKTTSNLLSEMDLPLSSGFSSYTENVGEVENKGFELMASAFLIRDTQRELIWSVTGRLVHNKSEIIKLSEAIKSQNELVKLRKVTNPNQLFYEGDPIDAIYVVPSLGIDPSTGKELFLNKDGEVTSVWDPEDRVFAGVATPKFRGNLSSMFRYKNFNLNASFAYQWGGQYYNRTLISKIENADHRYNVDQRVYDDRWQKPGDKTFFKDLNNKEVTLASSRFVQDESTFTCQNINLSYDLKSTWVRNNFKVQSLRFAFNTENLFYISTIKAERGTSYPFSRKFSMSVAARF